MRSGLLGQSRSGLPYQSHRVFVRVKWNRVDFCTLNSMGERGDKNVIARTIIDEPLHIQPNVCGFHKAGPFHIAHWTPPHTHTQPPLLFLDSEDLGTTWW